MFSYNGTFGIHYPILPDESPKLDPEDIEHVCKVAVQQSLKEGSYKTLMHAPGLKGPGRLYTSGTAPAMVWQIEASPCMCITST